MPAFDKTGPQGSGPMTGRKLGPCNKSKLENFPRGFGRPGFGRRQNIKKEVGQDK